MRYFLVSLFMFFFLSVVGQTGTIDSLSVFIKNYQKEDTTRVNALNELSNQYQWTNFYHALKYAEQALALAEALHFNKGIATAKYLKGHCFWALGDSEIAIELGLESIRISELEDLETILAEGYQILARSYMDQLEGEKAVAYINKAEKTSIKAKNWEQLSRVYNLAGVIQFVDRDIDSALLLYKKALSISEEHRTPKIHQARIVSNIGECYLRTNEKLAFNYFHQALTLARETNNRAAEAGISAIVGVALVKKGNYSEANTYLQASLQLSRELGLKRVTRHVYSGLADLRAREGKTSEAFGYMKSYYEVRDSLLNASKTRQIVELEARHELEKKEQAIKLLEQERRIEVIWRNIMIAAFMLFGLLAMVIYYLQAYRENKNREILNLEIDYLTAQHKEISEKYKNSLLPGNEKTIESHDQRLLKLAIEVVENNMNDPLFGVEKMAREMGMSRTNMHRKLKAITGFAPSDLIRTIRLRRAALLLLNQADSVSQISLMVGFDDHSYFTKLFKKQYGVPPSEYLASVNRTEQLILS